MGAPVIATNSVQVDNVVALWRAGESLEAVAEEYGLTVMPRKPSAASRPEFFVDRSLGRSTTAQLQQAGWTVHLVNDHFDHDAQFVKDETWIEYGLRRDWALLTKIRGSGIGLGSCCASRSAGRCSASAAETSPSSSRLACSMRRGHVSTGLSPGTKRASAWSTPVAGYRSSGPDTATTA
ncbi:MAG: DUF433 domain-containing protein [Pseudonocardiaceae bacterium]